MSDHSAPRSLQSPTGHAFLPLPEGPGGDAAVMKAICRRMSGATLPEREVKRAEYQQVAASALDASPEARLVSRCSFWVQRFETDTGGVAGTQSPANRCEALGIGSVTLCDLWA
jgi:hypothetical protein